jgi:DNA polymerase-4
MAIFLETTCLVEPMSLDEAFLDVTEAVAYGQDPVLLAKDLRKHIKSNLGLTISIGVATNKSVAKIASDMDKPDGLTVVDPGTECDFLAPLSVGKLWGIGPKMSSLLAHQGIRTIGQMTDRPEDWWIGTLGKLGPQIRKLALGRDDRPVVINRERKSISAETTLNRDTLDSDVLNDLVDRLSQHVQ